MPVGFTLLNPKDENRYNRGVVLVADPAHLTHVNLYGGMVERMSASDEAPTPNWNWTRTLGIMMSYIQKRETGGQFISLEGSLASNGDKSLSISREIFGPNPSTTIENHIGHSKVTQSDINPRVARQFISLVSRILQERVPLPENYYSSK